MSRRISIDIFEKGARGPIIIEVSDEDAAKLDAGERVDLEPYIEAAKEAKDKALSEQEGRDGPK